MGRVAVFELLQLDSTIRQMVQDRRSSEEIKTTAIGRGMVTLRRHGIEKALAGMTSLSEIIRLTIE